MNTPLQRELHTKNVADRWVDQVVQVAAMGATTIPAPLVFDTAEMHTSLLGNGQISLVNSTVELRNYDPNTMIIVARPVTKNQSEARVDALSNFNMKDFYRCMVFIVAEPDEITGPTDETGFFEDTRREIRVNMPDENSES